jgi:hypothetical protein
MLFLELSQIHSDGWLRMKRFRGIPHSKRSRPEDGHQKLSYQKGLRLGVFRLKNYCNCFVIRNKHGQCEKMSSINGNYVIPLRLFSAKLQCKNATRKESGINKTVKGFAEHHDARLKLWKINYPTNKHRLWNQTDMKFRSLGFSGFFWFDC